MISQFLRPARRSNVVDSLAADTQQLHIIERSSANRRREVTQSWTMNEWSSDASTATGAVGLRCERSRTLWSHYENSISFDCIILLCMRSGAGRLDYKLRIEASGKWKDTTDVRKRRFTSSRLQRHNLTLFFYSGLTILFFTLVFVFSPAFYLLIWFCFIFVYACSLHAATTPCPRKKLYPCVRCHNSGKQRRILTKFYANTDTLNCKQATKFQQNRSTSATATPSLVRSLKSISVHHRYWRDWLSSVRPCEWQDVTTPKVCVVHRVLERELEDNGRHCLTDDFGTFVSRAIWRTVW